jgi:hypothetical protein
LPVQNLEAETYKEVRKGLIDTVLATDMSRHFVLLNKFTTIFGTDEDSLSLDGVSEVSGRILRREF